MKGAYMLSYVPLHLSPLQHQADLLPWIRQWTGQPTLHPLSLTDWYRKGQGFRGGKSDSGHWALQELEDQWYL